MSMIQGRAHGKLILKDFLMGNFKNHFSLSFCFFVFFFSSFSFAEISVFFNQRSTTSYTDPYRMISRRGDNLEQVLLENILKAKRSILLAVQELRLPLVAKALVQKKNEGLDVRVVLEHDYHFNVLTQRENIEDTEYEVSKLVELKALIDINRDGRIQVDELEERDAIYILQKGQVKIIDDASDNSMGSGLMHHKFVVIDGEKVIMSSANFTMSCVHGDILNPSSLGNPNSMIVVNSKPLAHIYGDEFSELWGDGVQGRFGLGKSYRGPQTVTVDGVKITVQFSPTSLTYRYFETVNGLIRSYLNKSNHSIESALFVFSDQMLSDVMLKRFTQGVRVGVIMEPKFAYRDYSELLDLLGVRMLNSACLYEEYNRPWPIPTPEAGIAQLPYGDVLHHKFAVIDKKTVIMGSHNWSYSANHINDESLVVIESKKVANEYHQEYARLFNRARFGAIPWLLDQIDRKEEACAQFQF